MSRLVAFMGAFGLFCALLPGISQAGFDEGLAVYALYNLSAAGDPSSANKATANRADLAGSMRTREIEAAQNLAREMTKPGGVFKALDKYVQSTALR